MQWGCTCLLFYIYLCSVLYQHTGNIIIITCGCRMDGKYMKSVVGWQVNIGTLKHQEPCYLKLPEIAGQSKRCKTVGSVIVHGIRVCINDMRHHIKLANRRSFEQAHLGHKLQ